MRPHKESQAAADGLEAGFEKAVPMAQEAWMAVIALYWRGFAQARLDEQPDIDAVSALTNGHRPLECQEVYGRAPTRRPSASSPAGTGA